MNFDVPDDPRDYVHRVGRTARGDDTGDAVTLMASSDWVEIRSGLNEGEQIAISGVFTLKSEAKKGGLEEHHH